MDRNYEAMFVVSSAADQGDQLTQIMDKYRQLIADNGGEVQQLVKWDKRRLAYEVAGQREGIYLLLNFKSAPHVMKELDRVFRISDDVIRHLIIRVEEKHVVAAPAPPPAEEKEAAVVEESPAAEPGPAEAQSVEAEPAVEAAEESALDQAAEAAEPAEVEETVEAAALAEAEEPEPAVEATPSESPADERQPAEEE